MVEKDTTINRLLKQQQHNQHKQPSPPVTLSTNIDVLHKTESLPSIDSKDISLLNMRLATLQKQHDELFDAKLECINQGEATGKVNKEVKSFFVATRQRLINDAALQ